MVLASPVVPQTMMASVPFHLKVQQLPQGGEIHGLFGKGRDNGHTGPGEERLFQCTHAPFQLEMGN
jgi:hypothetical protein